MRTNIELDDALLAEAMKFSGQKTKKGAVEEALRKYVRLARQKQALDDMHGMGWEGDLDKMREDWTPDTDWGLQDKT